MHPTFVTKTSVLDLLVVVRWQALVAVITEPNGVIWVAVTSLVGPTPAKAAGAAETQGRGAYASVVVPKGLKERANVATVARLTRKGVALVVLEGLAVA